MAQYTPNFNLYKPDTSDDFADFRAEHNNNMDIIDANLGGGGGSGGHTIIDENGQSMTQRTGLEFTGNVQVTDDSVNDKTIVDILGGGGNVYGAFVNTSNLIYSGTYSLNLSYTATEDCFVWFAIPIAPSTSGKANIDGLQVSTFWNGTGAVITDSKAFYLKKGQILTATATNSSSASYYVYGLTQGTNGIFAPVIYSDTERVIGIWRDNKPLYQKTVDCGLVTADSNWHSIAHGVSNMDDCVGMEAICIKTGTTDIVNGYRPALNLGIALERNGANLQYMNTWFGTGDRRLIVTLRYTKTTDVAGSGNWNTDGVPTHHYSTSEQVVGTWTNGKPCYEITLEGSGYYVSNIEHIISIPLNADNVRIMSGFVDIGTDWLPISLTLGLGTGSTNGVYCYPNKSNGLHLFSSAWTFTKYSIVIQYTKTTDT